MAASKEHQMVLPRRKSSSQYTLPVKSQKQKCETNCDICSKLIIKKLERIWAAKSS